MRPLLERLGGFLPAAIALALPTVFLPIAVDSYILPRAAIVIAGAGIGLGLALLVPGGPSLGAARVPIAAAAGAAVLAFVFSVSWPVSLVGSYTRYESLPIRLSYLGIFAASVWLLRDKKARDRVIPAFVLGSAIASIQALWQQVLLSNQLIDYRPDGNLGNANLLGALLAMAIPLALASGLRGGRFLVAWWLGVAGMGIALVATTSRSGGLGALAACLALVVFSLKGRKSLVAAAVAAAVVGIALLAILFSPLRLLNDDPGTARLHLGLDAIHMIAARPVTGWGEDTTGLVFGRFLSGAWAPQVDRAHWGPLDIAATQGVLGVAALAWVLFTLFRGLWRVRFTESVAALGAACVGFSVVILFNFDWAPATGAFWLLAGTAWSAAVATEGKAAMHATRDRGWLPAGRALRSIGALSAVAFVVWFGALPVLADVWYYQGRLDLAVIADPLQGRYHWLLGQNLVGSGSSAGGLDELLLAGRLGESNPQLYVDIGDVQQRLGRTAEARAAYRMALIIDPYYGPALKRLAG